MWPCYTWWHPNRYEFAELLHLHRYTFIEYVLLSCIINCAEWLQIDNISIYIDRKLASNTTHFHANVLTKNLFYFIGVSLSKPRTKTILNNKDIVGNHGWWQCRKRQEVHLHLFLHIVYIIYMSLCVHIVA